MKSSWTGHHRILPRNRICRNLCTAAPDQNGGSSGWWYNRRELGRGSYSSRSRDNCLRSLETQILHSDLWTCDCSGLKDKKEDGLEVRYWGMSYNIFKCLSFLRFALFQPICRVLPIEISRADATRPDPNCLEATRPDATWPELSRRDATWHELSWRNPTRRDLTRTVLTQPNPTRPADSTQPDPTWPDPNCLDPTRPNAGRQFDHPISNVQWMLNEKDPSPRKWGNSYAQVNVFCSPSSPLNHKPSNYLPRNTNPLWISVGKT